MPHMPKDVKEFKNEIPKKPNVESQGEINSGVDSGNLVGENKFLALLVVLISLDFMLAQYVSNMIYGLPIVGMQVLIVNILGRRWGVKEVKGWTNWFVTRIPKRGENDDA